MKPHEFAEIFPLMNGKEFRELKEDIKEHGQVDPIIIYEGKILDGRNRYNAVTELGIKPKYENSKCKDDGEALQYVMSTNLKRRHLTDSQKAVVGIRHKKYYSLLYPKGKHHPLLVGDDVKKPKDASDRAGIEVGVSGSYIEMAESVIKVKPELEEKIMAGEIKVKQAYREIQLEKQKKEIEELKEVTGEYNVIVIDPPWQYYADEDYDNENYMGRVVAPYPTMTIPEIRNIKLPAADNCVLWLWTTHRFIWDAIELLKHWGFEYKAILVWDKEKLGIGKTLRMQCEFCLLGFKGKPYWKLTNERDIIREARTSHSTKPESFYKLVDKLCAGRKLDYFNKQRKIKGWDSYGN